MDSTAPGQAMAPPPATADQGAPPGRPAAERLSAAVQQQLNLESVKARAVGLYKAISRILEDFDMYSRTNGSPKWQEVLGQFSMVSMELFNIVEDIKKVSKAFVVYPRNVNAENATILPVMLSSKLLPEMETEDNAKRELLLNAITKNPIQNQIEKLKMRIDMIGAACEAAEKVIVECRKMYGLGSRQGPHLAPTLDKAQAAKIQEQENLLRAAVNYGEGLRIQGDQRQMQTPLPSHLVELVGSGDGTHSFADNSGGGYSKGAPMQVPGSQLVGGRSAPSPAGPTFENVSTPPMPSYANNSNPNIANNAMNNINNNNNSPRSGANLMNNNNMAASPQQQQAQLQHQRQQKIMQQVNSQQQMRIGASQTVLGQGAMPQLHDLQGQTQQKLHQVQGQMQYTQPTLAQQYQNRTMQSALNMQQNMVQNNQLRSHLGQFSGTGNNPLYGTAQASPNSQMLTNMSATMQPRMQFGLTQRNLQSQMLNDQMFGMGPTNQAMVGIPQQQGMFSNMNTNPQNMQQGMMGMQNPGQNPNLTQQRTQNQL